MKTATTSILLASALLTTPAIAADKTIVETAVEAGSFDTLVSAVQAAELATALSGDGPFTVFAPTDAAFAALTEGTCEQLMKRENRGKLTSILTFHVVPGRLMASDVLESDSLTTLNGQRLAVEVRGDDVMIGGAVIESTDIACSNGVIHVIGAVMMPVSDNICGVAGKAGQFDTLVAAARAAGLVEALSSDGPLTVFAPTDAAFEKLPPGTVESLLLPENMDKLAGILKYHVVPGRIDADQLQAGRVESLEGSELEIEMKRNGVMVSGAKVVTEDIEASNGVIHVIDTVMLPQ